MSSVELPVHKQKFTQIQSSNNQATHQCNGYFPGDSRLASCPRTLTGN